MEIKNITWPVEQVQQINEILASHEMRQSEYIKIIKLTVNTAGC